MKHFINLDDFDKNQLTNILNVAIELKQYYKSGAINNTLQNKTLAMIFDKPSTRTRVSFEAGMTQLGGRSLFLFNADTQIDRGELIADSAKVISSMVDCVMLRISSHQQIEEFAENSQVPVINALSNESHPCQLLADLMTFTELKGDISGKTLTWIGDGNNMVNTWAQAAKVFDFTLNIASPTGYTIKKRFLNNNIQLFDDSLLACQNSEAIMTDVWSSMGQESEQQQRIQAFKNHQVTQQHMDIANNDAIFMHCLPAHRGEEVADEVIDGKQSVVFIEAENRLHAQKALLLSLIG